MTNHRAISLKDFWKMTLFGSAVIIYAFFSSSTPDNIGMAEMAIAFFLVLLVGIRGILAQLIPGNPRTPLFIKFSKVAFVFLLIVPTITGIMVRNNSPSDYFRDIVPLFYMFLFLLLRPIIQRQPSLWLTLLSFALVMIGIAFSVRFFMIPGVDITRVGQTVFFGDFNYFPMDPAVTFGATFSALEAIRALGNKSVGKAAAFALTAVICLASLAAMLVRAPLILFVLIVFFRLVTLKGTGLSVLVLKTIMGVALVYAIVAMMPLLYLVEEKFLAVGANAKGAEIASVASYSWSGLSALMFGTGWGGVAFSLAVNMQVRYVHNFPFYFLLKAGLFGFIYVLVMIAVIYFRGGLVWLRRLFNRAEGLDSSISALGASLIVLSSSFFLQANFKSLSFGLVLSVALIVLGQMEARIVQRRSGLFSLRRSTALSVRIAK